MIDIKGNIDHVRVYYYSNEHLFRSELIKLGSYEFYDKYLCNLTPREYLDFLQLLFDDIIERWDHVEVRGGSDLPPELDTSFS